MRAPLDDWQPPIEWGIGAHARHLRNLYVYFWRWAAWKVFGGAPFRGGTDISETHWTERRGVVCFITAAGFLNNPGFQKMRADLRRDADEIYVIDCSPEGHQSPQSTRIFQDVQQPVCIVLALRRSADTGSQPAAVNILSLAESTREQKFDQLAAVALYSEEWISVSDDWRAPFLLSGAVDWVSYPAIEDLFQYNGTGAMLGRTWPIAPDSETLSLRWMRLISEDYIVNRANLFHPHLRSGKPGDKHIDKAVKEQFQDAPHRTFSVANDKETAINPVRLGFRSFDRQWIIPDARLINQPNSYLWSIRSDEQIFLTAPQDRTPTNGPALSFTAHVPDVHHYHGRGGRVFPLWADAAATEPNMPAGLLTELSASYGRPVTGRDVFAYVAAVAASPAYTARFQEHLRQPGLRIPFTAERGLFDEAVALGREVVWLHTFGERFAEGWPPGTPRVAKDGPTIPAGGTLPDAWADLPHDLDYDAAKRRLKVGKGFVSNVLLEVWDYEVSGKSVVRQWWSYRRADRSKPPMGDKRPPSKLSDIKPPAWLAEYTTELLALLHVLTRLVALEPLQADLLDRIVSGALIDSDALRATGSLGEASAEALEDVDGEDG